MGKGELEQHFLAPLAERVFGDYPDLDDVKDLRGAGLPRHITVHEFFMKTGDYLHNEVAQQGHISTQYTFVARDMLVQGMNVIAQAVASRGDMAGQGADWRLSVSSNPDVVFEVVERFAAEGKPLLKVGVVNQQMPLMPHGAEVAPGFFDIVITEYGVADLRGQVDSEVVKRLIAVADSRFQPWLVRQAKAHGKLPADYQVLARARQPARDAGRQAAPLEPGRAAAGLPLRHRHDGR